MLQGGKLIKAFCGDFCAAQETAAGQGSYAFVVGFDAAGNIVIFGGMYTIYPESTFSWELILTPLREYYGDLIDCADAVFISDAVLQRRPRFWPTQKI